MNETLHTHKTETFYQEVLKQQQEMSLTSNLACRPECQQTTEEMQQEDTWSADEIAYGLEIRLTDEQLAIIEAGLRSGIELSYVGSGAADEETHEKIAEAVQDAYDEVGNCNVIAVIDHDDIVIVRWLLEKVASGKSLDKEDRVWAGIGAQYLKAGELETPIQRHARFLAHKERKASTEATSRETIMSPNHPKWSEFCKVLWQRGRGQWTCDHTFCRELLPQYNVNTEASIEFFRERCGFDDLEVLLNVDAGTTET